MRIESVVKTPLGSTPGKNQAKYTERIVRATSELLDQNGAAWTSELGVAPPAASEPEAQSIEERLRRLDVLHKEGLINEDDFEARKQAILSEL